MGDTSSYRPWGARRVRWERFSRWVQLVVTRRVSPREAAAEIARKASTSLSKGVSSVVIPVLVRCLGTRARSGLS